MDKDLETKLYDQCRWYYTEALSAYIDFIDTNFIPKQKVSDFIQELEEIENPHLYPDGVEMTPEYGVFEDMRDKAMSLADKLLNK